MISLSGEIVDDRARLLRKNATDAETLLWYRLRARRLGYKFRRQHRILGYIADFSCFERRLIVELDGGQHLERVAYDACRTAKLERVGYRVLRFWNDEVLQQTEAVLEAILLALHEELPPHPNPLPRPSRGRGSR